MRKEILRDAAVLRQVSAPANDLTVQRVVADLIDTASAIKNSCAGLAAIQIGYPVRVFILKDKNRFVPYINPQVKEFRGGTVFSKEGCLSFPDKKRVVKRHKEVVLATGAVLKGFISIVFQHEYDHLEGRCLF